MKRTPIEFVDKLAEELPVWFGFDDLRFHDHNLKWEIVLGAVFNVAHQQIV